MIQKLSPGSEEHSQVEFVWDDYVSWKFGDSLTQKSRIGKILEGLAFCIFITYWCFSDEVGVGFTPVVVDEIVATSIDGSQDIFEFEEIFCAGSQTALKVLDEDAVRCYEGEGQEHRNEKRYHL